MYEISRAVGEDIKVGLGREELGERLQTSGKERITRVKKQ